MSRIVAVRHGEDGSIASYKTDDGHVYDREEAVRAADAGELEGVSSFTTRDGSFSIRSDRGQYDYSLENLPEY